MKILKIISAISLSLILFTGCEKESELSTVDSGANTLNSKLSSTNAKSGLSMLSVISLIGEQEAIEVEGTPDNFTYYSVPYSSPGGPPTGGGGDGNLFFPDTEQGRMDAAAFVLELLEVGCGSKVDRGYGTIAVNITTCD